MATGTEHLAALEAEARDAIAAATDLQSLTETRSRYLGKSGSISGLLRGIGGLDAEQRREVGAAANASKERVEAWVSARRDELERARIEGALRERRLDVTLPGHAAPLGHLHPITRVMRDMESFFAGLGFSVEEGPEVETDWNNFGALNVPSDHPSRDVQETFFVEGGHVLRTHTSSVQIRAMAGRTPPFRFIAPGRVYRRENDGTHSPVFHQIEGMMVDERVTFGDLKGVLHAFARHLMGPEVRLRFRAHFFPFTEPSAEMDFSWGDRWLEWGGCGMIHPNVLRNCGIDPERYQGFAFGMGIDRTAMLRYGIPHVHHIFEGDVRLLEQIA
jgi:phenylalanyl-tRNA synthetase alpha chain